MSKTDQSELRTGVKDRDPNRRTGRSTRMLLLAIDEARHGKSVAVVSARSGQRSMLGDIAMSLIPPLERDTLVTNKIERSFKWPNGGLLVFKLFFHKKAMDYSLRGWRGERYVDHYSHDVWVDNLMRKG